MKKRIAVLISGSGTNLQALLDACARPDFPAEIALVLSNKADAFGLQRALRVGVKIAVVNHKEYPSREDFDAAMQEILLENSIDLVCLAGFMRLLSASFVEKWSGRMINIHPSLLPAFKGLDTHARALAAGVKFVGCTVHFVVPEMDAGPIITQAVVPVNFDDDVNSLRARVLDAEHVCYVNSLRWLAEGRLLVEGLSVKIKQVQQADNILFNPL